MGLPMVFSPSVFQAQSVPGRSTQPQGRSEAPDLSTTRTTHPSRSRLTAGVASYLVSHRGCLHFRIRVPDDLMKFPRFAGHLEKHV